MSDRSLRSALIRLAHVRPEFRKDILALLKSADDAGAASHDQNKADHWYGLDPKKPGVTEPALPAKSAGCKKQG